VDTPPHIPSPALLAESESVEEEEEEEKAEKLHLQRKYFFLSPYVKDYPLSVFPTPAYVSCLTVSIRSFQLT
jgi:hypothetical protein